MARQQVVSYSVTCDVCGEDIAGGDVQGATQKISWEGADYVVDMCARDQEALGVVLDRLKTFVTAGAEKATTARRGAGSGRSASKGRAKAKATGPRQAAAPKATSGPGRSDQPAIRAWALENGYQVGHRGRIPAGVVTAYDQSHSPGTSAPAPKKRRPRKAEPVSV